MITIAGNINKEDKSIASEDKNQIFTATISLNRVKL